MQTSAVTANYNLTEDGYRAEVRAATGPVSRQRSVTVPIGDLTPEARLAVADGERYRYQWGNPSSIDMPASDAPPDAGAVSAALVDWAKGCRQKDLDRLRWEADINEKKFLEEKAKIARWEDNPGLLLSTNSDGTWDWERPRVFIDWPGEDAFYERLKMMAQERNEAQQAEEMARIAACNSELAKYASAVPPNVERAASEGRDTRKVWMDWAVQIVDLAVQNAGDDTATSYSASERADVPTAEAYRALDLARSIAKTKCNGNLPDPFALTVGPIARHDIAPKGREIWRTGVEITVSCPWLDRAEGVVILAEPRVKGDDSGDNDDE